MKRLFLALLVTAASLTWTPAARSIPVNCILCGSTPLGPATISYAVISGMDFNTELGVHNIGFLGAVPSGTLDAIPDVTAPTDFVYLYQLVNNQGPPLLDYTVAGAGISAPLLTGGGRLESTLFLDPLAGLVSPGPVGSTTALTPGSPTVDFVNGLNGNFGPCQSSAAAGVNCSDATANLSPGVIQATNFAEAPSAPLLDPMWTSSIMWFSIAAAPGSGLATAIDPTGLGFSGFVPAPAAVPVPAAVWLFATALTGFIGLSRRRNIT